MNNLSEFELTNFFLGENQLTNIKNQMARSSGPLASDIYHVMLY